MQRIVNVTLHSISPFGFARYHGMLRHKGESLSAYHDRTWREHCHYEPTIGQVFIPGKMFQKSLVSAARLLARPPKGKSTISFVRRMETGVFVPDNLYLPEIKDSVQGITVTVSKYA